MAIKQTPRRQDAPGGLVVLRIAWNRTRVPVSHMTGTIDHEDRPPEGDRSHPPAMIYVPSQQHVRYFILMGSDVEQMGESVCESREFIVANIYEPTSESPLNLFVERLWHTVRYEDIYIREHTTGPALAAGLRDSFRLYNYERSHKSLGYRTPDGIYFAVNEPQEN